jgi:hypothetical protein
LFGLVDWLVGLVVFVDLFGLFVGFQAHLRLVVVDRSKWTWHWWVLGSFLTLLRVVDYSGR